MDLLYKGIGEFSRISDIFAPLSTSYPGAYGLKDDAAVLTLGADQELVVTTDSLIEGIHFLPDDRPEIIASKLLRVNLSDLAAMGACPLYYTLNIALPSYIEDVWVEDFAGGLANDQMEFSVTLIGGDSVTTKGPIVLTSTAYGYVASGCALKRSGAKVGDVVFVSGFIGDGAIGLRVATNKIGSFSTQHAHYLRQRYEKPEPRVLLGKTLVGVAHSAIDISDGLLADLEHIAESSGVLIEVDDVKIPISNAGKVVLEKKLVSKFQIYSGGDDYELAFSVPENARDTIARCAKNIRLPLTEIGRVRDGTGLNLLDENGVNITPRRMGYVHD